MSKIKDEIRWISICFFLLYNHFTPANGISEIVLAPSRCGSTEPASEGMIIRSAASDNYTLPAGNCSFVMTALTSAHRLRFAFNTGSGDIGALNNPLNNSTACAGSSIEIFDGASTAFPSLTSKLCGNLTSSEILSTRDTLTLLILSDGNDTFMNFTAHYTSFTNSSNCGNDFPCVNGRCISTDMACDATGIDNCGDLSDNFAGPPGNCSSETTTTPDITSTAQSTTISTTAGAVSSSGGDGLIAVYAVAGVIGGLALLFLHWLLFKPRWMIWRLCWFGRHGCYKNVSNCFGRNAVNSSPSLDKITSTPSPTPENNSRENSPEYSSPEASRENDGTEFDLSESPFVRGIAKENHIFTVRK